jgi:branched-chain amino acid transport system ATP-binding protein
MLCIARTLAGNPAAILLDEPSEGLAPLVVENVATAIREVKRAGVTVLLAEQSRRFAERVADRGYFLEKGVIRPL